MATRIDRGWTRRMLALMGAVGLLVLSACIADSSDGEGDRGTVKIGYVTPRTGPLAPFGEADTFAVNQMTRYFQRNPIRIGATTYDVEILVKDSGSDPTKAGQAAAELIRSDRVDLILVASTAETVNPVADVCEANAVPCISTVAPWQQYRSGRGATAEKSFTWTFHFFWGLEDVAAVYQDMWAQVTGANRAGALWPDDADGTAWGDPANGLRPVVAESGYTVADPGFYPNGTADFTAQISRFKQDNAEILLGVPSPREFSSFWTQANQQGYAPKIVTVGRALLFPSAVEALGAEAHNIGTEVWWSPNHPFTSSLTRQSAEQLADTYAADTDSQWTQPIGFVHALFEVAAAALTKAGGTDKQAVANAMRTLRVDTIVGPLDWTSGPAPNVAKTPLVGGQWRESVGGPFPFELVIVSNAAAPEIPTGGAVEPLS